MRLANAPSQCALPMSLAYAPGLCALRMRLAMRLTYEARICA
jgi:hypothetical protein